MDYLITIINKHGLKTTITLQNANDDLAWKTAWKVFAAEDIFISEIDKSGKEIRRL